jgi:hypothetical protein
VDIDVRDAGVAGLARGGHRQPRPVDALRPGAVHRHPPYQQCQRLPGRLQVVGLQPHALSIRELQLAQRQPVRQVAPQAHQAHVVGGEIRDQGSDPPAAPVGVADGQQRDPQQHCQQHRHRQDDQADAGFARHQNDCPRPM